MMPMRKLVGISAEQWAALDARRVATGVPVTVQVRQAVAAWLERAEVLSVGGDGPVVADRGEPIIFPKAPQPNAPRQPTGKAAKLAKAKAALQGAFVNRRVEATISDDLVDAPDWASAEEPLLAIPDPTPRGVNKGCARCTARCWARCQCPCHGDA